MKATTQLETQLVEALRGMLAIKRHIAGCPQPDCNVCRENNAIIETAETAVEEYDRIAKRGRRA